MKERLVPSTWLEQEGRRLDCGPYLSGVIEARVLLNKLSATTKKLLKEVTLGGLAGIFYGPRFRRNYVRDPQHGVPFLGSTDILNADLTFSALLSRKEAVRRPELLVKEGWTLITRSGTVGRMAFARSEMDGRTGSEDFIRIVPEPAKIRSGYLYSYLSSRFGLPFVTGSTYGAIVQHIEPAHIADLPVPLAPDEVQKEAHRLVTEAAELRTKASAELRAVIREMEEAAGLPPLDVRYVGVRPDTSLVRASTLGGRMDSLFHSLYHRSVLEPLLRLPHERRTIVGDLAERVFKPPMFKKIPVADPRFGLPLFSTAAILRSDPDTDDLLSRRAKGFENLIVNKTTVLIPADGQLNGIIGHPVLPIGDVVGGTVNNHAIRLFCANEHIAGYLFAGLSSEYARRQLKARAYGSSIPSLDETGVSGVVLPLLDDEQMESLGLRAFAVRTARHEAVIKEREARSLVERWIEQQGAS